MAKTRRRSWEESYELLVRFQKRHGHLLVPAEGATRRLGHWVWAQRTRYWEGRLVPAQIRKLERIGFAWSIREDSWSSHVSRYKRWKKRSGGDELAGDLRRDDPELASWVSDQRKRFKEGRLSDERRSELEACGFVWDTPEARWQAHFAAMKAFRARHGHTRVQPSHDPELAAWAVRQRLRRRRGRLDPAHEAKLSAIGFDWLSPRTRPLKPWDESFAELERFHARHGHCRVPDQGRTRRLGIWVKGQRERYRDGELEPDRVRRLERLGFTWSVWEDSFEEHVARFAAWRKAHRDPQRDPGDDDAELDRWIGTQRKYARQGTLSAERRAELDRAGLVWDPLERRWQHRLSELRSFQKIHGHTRVTQDDDSKLANWIAIQRQGMRLRKISDEKIRQLDAIGFDWYPTLGKVPRRHQTGRRRRRGRRRSD